MDKDRQRCGNCYFFIEDGNPDTPGLNPCKLMPDPQPVKKEQDWCGQWKADKK